MSDSTEFNISFLESVEIDSLVHDNTQIRAQATFMHINGAGVGNSNSMSEEFPILVEPSSGLKIDPELVLDALKKEWYGRDEQSFTDEKGRRVYWQSLEPGTMMAWTTVIDYKNVGAGRFTHEVFDNAYISVQSPIEYQNLLADSAKKDVSEMIQMATDPKKGNGLGKFAAKLSLLTNNPKSTIRNSHKPRHLRHLE